MGSAWRFCSRANLLLGLGIVLVGAVALWRLPDYRYDAIVIHHTASGFGNYRSLRGEHLKRGWFEAAYHLVLSNGSTAVPAGHLEPTLRHRLSWVSVATRNVGCNAGAIHLVVVGNYDTQPLPEALRAPLAHAVRGLQRRYGIADDAIRLHRDCSSTACPGRELTRDRIRAWLPLAEDCPEGMRRQQQGVLASPWLESRSVLRSLAASAALAGFCWAIVGLGTVLLSRRRVRRRRPRRRR